MASYALPRTGGFRPLSPYKPRQGMRRHVTLDASRTGSLKLRWRPEEIQGVLDVWVGIDVD